MTKPQTSVEDARRIVRERTSRCPVISVPCERSAGFVLAESVEATEPVQPFRNSAMDGFAVRYDEAKRARDEDSTLSIAGEVAAGDTGTDTLEDQECVRITTGAPVPEDCDTVIRVEDAIVRDNTVYFTRLPSEGRGDNVRDAGEDIELGQTVLDPGNVIRPYELGVGLLAGRTKLDVYRAPRVAIISTGDELVKEPGAPLGPGQVRDVNRFTLAEGARQAGAEVSHVSTLPDNFKQSIKRIRSLFQNHEVVVTSGGVSMGEYDFIRDVLEETDVELHFHKVWQKPGKPLGFGSEAGTLLFALPGNVVSSMVNFELYVRPAILRMRGFEKPERKTVKRNAAAPFPQTDRRTFFFRAQYVWEGNEEKVMPTGTGQESHIMTSLSEADCLVEVTPHSSIESGDDVLVRDLNRPYPLPGRNYGAVG